MFEKLDWTRFQGKKVGIATGGSSMEREISLATGAAFEKALRSKGYAVDVFDIPADLGRIASDRPAAMLLGIHGGLGEGGALQGFLECLGIPYTGSGVLASALAMDKARAKVVCRQAGVPVAAGITLVKSELASIEAAVTTINDALDFPLVAKLNDSGSSYGVHICADEAQLRKAIAELASDIRDGASSSLLVERFLDGPEYSVGFFAGQALGVMKITPESGFYDFEAKYQRGDTLYDVVDDPMIVEPLIAWSRSALRALGCRGVARVDFKGRPGSEAGCGMLEVNTIPGMTSTSLVPKLAAKRDLRFEDFVEAMLVTARLDEG